MSGWRHATEADDGRCMIRAAADRPVAVDEALARRAYEGAQRLAEQLEMLGMGEAAREVRGIREGVAALLSMDLACENTCGPGNGCPPVYDACIRQGRTVDAQYGADRACWPCTIRHLLGARR